MNGLAFCSQLDELCDLQLFYDSNENEFLTFLDNFDMGEFDKLMPWFDRCRERGIEFEFFKDTAVKSFLLPALLADLRSCYGEIAQRKPFPTPGEPRTDAFLKMVAVLEEAIATKRGIIALCD